MPQHRIAVPLSTSEKALLKFAARAFCITPTKCFQQLLKFTPADVLLKHPAIAGDERRPHIFIFPVTSEQLTAINARAKELDRTRASFLRTLLNHLTDFAAADVLGAK